jgi:tetratricopeptide (TPR) repeat protein
MLAHHYVSALDLMHAGGLEPDADVGDRARAAFGDAGERALALNAFAAAAQFFASAIALAGNAPSHESALLEYGHAVALFRMGDDRRADALERARDALLAAGDRDRAAEAESLVAEVRWFAGRVDLCHEHLRRAEGLVADSSPSAEKARVLAQVARFQMLADDWDDALRTGASALELAEQLELDELRVDVVVTIGMAKANAGDLTGIDDLEHAIALAAGRAFRAAWRGYNNLAVAATHRLGDIPRAYRYSEEGLRVAERFGDRTQIVWFRGQFVYSMYELGEFDEAIGNADEVIAAAEGGFPNNVEASSRAFRACIRLARDDVEGAAADAQRAIELTSMGGLPLHDTPSTLTLAAVVLLGLGRRTEAAALVDEVIDRAGTRGVARASHSMLPFFAETLVALGRENELAEHTVGVVPSPWLAAYEAYAAGRYDVAADLLATLSVPDEAHARLRAARGLVDAGARAQADVQLQKALAFWRSVGATRYIREGEALLAASA